MVETKRRLAEKSSRTAGFTCMCRAASYLSKDPHYTSDDYIAPRLLPRLALMALKTGVMNFNLPPFPRGMLEYVIARTKYIDDVVERALRQGADQILLFGAGFDSRAVRFGGMNTHTTFFELDTHNTLNAKMKQFQKRMIPWPERTIIIPVDFNVDPLKETILRSGFDPGKRTLFILEGITMYLETETIDQLFTLLYEISGPDSSLVFDYIYAPVLRRENLYYGEKSIYKTVNRAREAWRFGIEPGAIECFVEGFGFHLTEHLTPEDMEERYFTDVSGKLLGRMNGTHCLAFMKK
ncbi:MAG: SAM-dependent methyltransferase [Spirochaetales bacterium]|nr:SAM-dependent methyltransferase [Spirochaetales bacterium]